MDARTKSLQQSIDRWYDILVLRIMNNVDAEIAYKAIIDYSLELELYIEFELDDGLLWQGMDL